MEFVDKYLVEGETWPLLCQRVAGLMAYNSEREIVEDDLLNMRWLPNTPCLLNAGRGGGRNLAACHAIEVENSIDGIFGAVKLSATIFRSGGGLGLELSRLSPRGTPLRYSPHGTASGPVSFLRVFDATAQVVMEGGMRRAAMLASLIAHHLDIMDFIGCKEQDGTLANFNMTVTMDDIRAVDREVWDSIVMHAYNNGEPGVAFLDIINRDNPTPQFGRLIALNACAELPLYSHSSCVLGSINLPKVVEKLGDWKELRRVTRTLTRFLDRVIDVNHYPTAAIAQATRRTRDIGIGPMGFDTLLKRHGIPYTSRDALELAHAIGRVIEQVALEESWQLAKEKGGYLPVCPRNARLTAIAPTGHRAQLAGVSFSIYPDLRTALEMTPEQHLEMVATWQVHTDSSISYTVNIPNDSSPTVVDSIFRGAWERGIKVMSVYRDGSRANQPCTLEGDCSKR